MKKIVRLTESDLTDIIKRIVEEAENDMESTEDEDNVISKKEAIDLSTDFFDDDDEDSVISRKEAIDLIANFFDHKVLSKLNSEEIRDLKRKSAPKRPRGIQEADKDSKSRMSNFKEKMMIRGGLGTAVAGVIATLSEFTGWSESVMLSKIHSFIEQAGAGNYAGPISVAMVAAGLALALKGKDVQYRRTNK